MIFWFLVLFTGAQDIELSDEKESDLTEQEVAELLAIVAPLPDLSADSLDATLFLEEGQLPDFTLLRTLLTLPEETVDLVSESKEQNKELEIEERGIDWNEFHNHQEQYFLRDPQSTLTARETTEIQDLLVMYAGESEYNLHLNLVVSEQDLSDEKITREDQTERGIHLYYFYGNPERSLTIYGSKSMMSVPSIVRDEILQFAMNEAKMQDDEFQALYRFVLDLTIRLNGFFDTTDNTPQPEVESVLTNTGVVVDLPVEARFSALLQVVLPFRWHFLGAGLLLLSGVGYWIWKRKVLGYYIPKSQCVSVLGFDHGIHCSEQLKFGIGSKEPREQKKNVLRQK